MESANPSFLDSANGRSCLDEDAGPNRREAWESGAAVVERSAGAAGWAPFPRPWRSDVAYGF